MWEELFGSFIDATVKYGFQLFTNLMDKRNLVAQGQAQQHISDLEATVKDATDATVIKDRANAMPDSAVADDIDRLRNNAASGNL